MKLSDEGDIQWQRCYGFQFGDYPEKIIQTADDGFAIIGRSDSLVMPGSYTIPVCWIVKTDSDGETEWARQYNRGIGSRGKDIRQTSYGGFVFVMEENPIISASDDTTSFHVVKINALGDVEWEKDYGGSSGEVPYAIRITSDNSYVIAGETWSTDGVAAGNHGGCDALVVKLGNATSVGNFNLKEYRIYPNPSSGMVQLEEFLKEAVIYDSNGRIVFSEINTDRLNLSSLPIANYILHGTTESGDKITAKIIRK